MLAPNNDAMKIYSRLYKLAVARYRCPPELAEDAASDAICSALAAGNLTSAYCTGVLKNYLFEYWRNRATRNEGYSLPINEEGEAIEPAHSATAPIQHARIEAIECANAIESLPPEVRVVMRYVAREFTTEEIAEILNLSSSE